MFIIDPALHLLPKPGRTDEQKREEREEQEQQSLEKYLTKRYGGRRLRRHQREMDEKEAFLLSVVDN